MQNTRIVLRRRPDGMPQPADFALETVAVPELAPGEFLVANSYIGLQPAARIRMSAGDSYAPPTPLGDVPYAQTVGQVVRSRHPDFPEGGHLFLDGGWQSHAISTGEKAFLIDPKLAPVSYALGCLGLSGMTAYVGLNTILDVSLGQTIVISAATGAVGSVAGQLAKALGCRVVGIAGGPDKCAAAVTEFGYDACVDHKDPAFGEQLAKACPDGIDLDFENVGGAVRDAVWQRMNPFGQVALCGLIAEYNAQSVVSGPPWHIALTRRLTVRGFLLRDHLHLRDAFVTHMTQLLAEGRLKTRETITHGIENTPAAFIDLLSGRNFGKAIVQL